MDAIEATGVLEVDIGWVNGNYQRILFHSVRTASADRDDGDGDRFCLNGGTNEADRPPPGRQVRPPRVPLAGRNVARSCEPGAPRGSRNAQPRWEVHEPRKRPRRRLAPSCRLRADARRAGVPGYHGRPGRARERHDSTLQAVRDPRTLARTSPVGQSPAGPAARLDTSPPRRPRVATSGQVPHPDLRRPGPARPPPIARRTWPAGRGTARSGFAVPRPRRGAERPDPGIERRADRREFYCC